MKVVIIGAGIIGLTLAKELLDIGYQVVLIDKEKSIGVHASGRNSGVLHSGIDYPKETLKAKFCQTGRPLFHEFCRQHNIDINQCGKVLVTKSKAELAQLELLRSRGQENGLKVQQLSLSELEAINQRAKTVDSALWVPETAVFDPKIVLSKLIDYIYSHKNGTISLGEAFVDYLDETKIRTTTQEISFDVFINCAGGYSDKIAHQFNVAKHLILIPFKGLYKKVSSDLAQEVNHHIYPIPDLENPFLGVHFTKAMNGDLYAGPTAIPAFGPENYKPLENIGRNGFNILLKDATLFLLNKKFRRVALSEPKRYIHQFFYNEAKKLVKGLKSSDLIASEKIGIRPQLVNWDTKELVMDFEIIRKKNHLHVLNAISPAFTCCFAFAKHIVNEHLN